MAPWKLQDELELFEKILQDLGESHGDFIYTVGGKKEDGITLTVMALVHGNEVAGIRVLNEILLLIKTKVLHLPFKMAFVLGNVPAAKSNVRFVERDLNRCFEIKTPDESIKMEEKRARVIEKILEQTQYLIDLHQTQTPTERSFFVVHYKKETCEFARLIDPSRTLLVFADGMKRTSGLTSTIFTQHKGGVALTLELGEKGLIATQVSEGLRVVLGAINCLHMGNRGMDVSTMLGESYEVVEKIFAKEGEEASLLPHIASNFKEVKKGEIYGRVGEKDLIAKDDGVIIFPKLSLGKNRIKMDPFDPICLLAINKKF